MPESIIPAAVSSQLDNTGEERIHVANIVPGGVVRTPWVAPALPFDSIFASWSGNSELFQSTVANPTQSDWALVEAGGLISTTETRIFNVNNRLFACRQSGRTRTSTDAISWVSVTGLTQSGTIESIIWTGTQYIAFDSLGTLCWVSPDGVNWSSQALGYTTLTGRHAYKGTTVIGFASTNNTVRVNTANGVGTYSSVSMGGAVTNFSKSYVTTTANRFLVFGTNTSTNGNVMKWSPTGLVATWTEVTLPGDATTTPFGQVVYNAGTNRLIAVRRDGSVYYSDDEGSTWSVGTSILQTTFYSTIGDHIIYSATNGRVYYLGFYSDGGAIDDYRVYSTADGITWTLHFSHPSSSNGLNNIATWPVTP